MATVSRNWRILHTMISTSTSLRIWKHSHGGDSFEDKEKERDQYKERSVITLYRDTGRGQGLAFREQMLQGDFFYLCFGNKVQLFGQITSNLQNAAKRWVERKYWVIRESSDKLSKFTGPQKKWTPNYNSTCALVPMSGLSQFEGRILRPFFSLRLRDLESQLLEESITAEEDNALASLPKKKYEEARRELLFHKRFEMVLTRNRKLVQEAKKYFKAKHGKLFCEGCAFDFQVVYGDRGSDFIEAHHSMPIAQIKPGTKLKVTDLRMVCANCHRMLHRCRDHWITLRELRNEMRLIADPRR
jgi:HNH endonuclease